MDHKPFKSLSRAIPVLMLVALLAFSGTGTVLLAHAAPGDITRVSVSSSEAQANGFSRDADISADGCFVAFRSDASNLVSGDTNGSEDIFLRDCQAGETTRISIGSGGIEADNDSFYPSISADGRFIAFTSDATNLVSDDTNGFTDIFLHDRQTGITSRVSVRSDGQQADNVSDSFTSISGDGRFIAFSSDATNLVDGDTNGFADVFVHDWQTGVTERVSLDSNETQANGGSSYPSISVDGRFVVFTSGATNLVSGDTNARTDVFVRDRDTGVTTRVSVNSRGEEASRGGHDASISADGRYVAFSSESSNLMDEEVVSNEHVYIHDRQTGLTTLSSIYSDGYQMVGWAEAPDLSADGRYITFEFDDKGDGVGFRAIYVHDRLSGITTGISGGGASEEDSSLGPAISADGRYIAFRSFSRNLVPGDTNGLSDIFLRELAIVAPTTKTYQSIGAYDGWVIESGEDAETGIRIDERASTFFVGDANNDQQYRSVLHFDTASLPNNAIITKVTLKIKKQGIVGNNPFTTHGSLQVGVRKPYFDTQVKLQPADFQAPSDIYPGGTFENTPGELWYTAVLDATAFPSINLSGTTQFRLHFALDDNDDNEQDYIKFFSGDAAAGDQPVLTIDYYSNSTGSPSVFEDVSTDHWAWDFIERLYADGITGGCSVSPLRYCPEEAVTRAQMAVFLEKGFHYPAAFTPPNVDPTFTDTPGHWAEDWIETLRADGITGGCGPNLYCPDSPVTRAQMAVFLLKSKYGRAYLPPAVGASAGFDDVPTTHWAAAWIKQLALEGITGGCASNLYCPESSVTRAQMAVFLVRTFNLP